MLPHSLLELDRQSCDFGIATIVYTYHCNDNGNVNPLNISSQSLIGCDILDTIMTSLPLQLQVTL